MTNVTRRLTRQYHRRSLLGAAVLAALPLCVLGASLLAGPASAAPAPASGCADVEIIAARGTTESGTVGGGLTPLANAITSGSTRTVATYGVPYPASTDWTTSVGQGVTLLQQHLASSAAACPSQKFVLLGYSQGAWVVGDALAGGSPLAASLGAKVAAVVLYGDPRFVAGEPFDVGTYKAGVNGVYPRAKGALATYASRINSFCDAGDTVCQNGASGTDHGTYAFTKTAAASQFVIGKLAGTSTPAPTTPTTAPTTPPTTTPPTTAPTTPPGTTAPTAPTAPGGSGGGLLGLLRSWFPWLSFFGR